MEDVLWCGLLKFDVPHKSNAVWFMRRVFVVVVGGNQQLGVLREVNKSTEGRLIPNAGEIPVYATQKSVGPTCRDQSREVITRCFDQCSS